MNKMADPETSAICKEENEIWLFQITIDDPIRELDPLILTYQRVSLRWYLYFPDVWHIELGC